MAPQTATSVDVPQSLLEVIRSFPRERSVEHCGFCWTVSPFEFYAVCPHCGTRFKLRSFSAVTEVEDVFDAVFEWMNQPGVEEIVEARRQAIAVEEDE